MSRLARRLALVSAAAIFLGFYALLLSREDSDYSDYLLRVVPNGYRCEKERSGDTRTGSSELEQRTIRPHTWKENGLLEVNREGRHPIFDLIEQSKRRWREKNERQSRTLKEAVEEYQRRYRRLPPKGFDNW